MSSSNNRLTPARNSYNGGQSSQNFIVRTFSAKPTTAAQSLARGARPSEEEQQQTTRTAAATTASPSPPPPLPKAINSDSMRMSKWISDPLSPPLLQNKRQESSTRTTTPTTTTTSSPSSLYNKTPGTVSTAAKTATPQTPSSSSSSSSAAAAAAASSLSATKSVGEPQTHAEAVDNYGGGIPMESFLSRGDIPHVGDLVSPSLDTANSTTNGEIRIRGFRGYLRHILGTDDDDDDDDDDEKQKENMTAANTDLPLDGAGIVAFRLPPSLSLSTDAGSVDDQQRESLAGGTGGDKVDDDSDDVESMLNGAAVNPVRALPQQHAYHPQQSQRPSSERYGSSYYVSTRGIVLDDTQSPLGRRRLDSIMVKDEDLAEVERLARAFEQRQMDANAKDSGPLAKAVDNASVLLGRSSYGNRNGTAGAKLVLISRKDYRAMKEEEFQRFMLRLFWIVLMTLAVIVSAGAVALSIYKQLF